MDDKCHALKICVARINAMEDNLTLTRYQYVVMCNFTLSLQKMLFEQDKSRSWTLAWIS